MLKNAEGYYGIFIAGLKSRFVYRKDWFMWMMVRFSAALVMILVFTAIYLGNGVASIRGFTLPFLYAYFFLANAIWYGLSIGIVKMMQDDIQSGTIASALIKPVGYVGRLVSNALSETVVSMIFIAIPMFAIGLLLSGVHVTIQTALIFSGELTLAYCLFVVTSFLVGTAAVYLVEVWPVSWLWWSIAEALGGMLMPLAFFPQLAQNLLMFTPFPVMIYTPVATLLGTASSQYIIITIASGAVWLVALTLLARIWWEKVRRDITSVGG